MLLRIGLCANLSLSVLLVKLRTLSSALTAVRRALMGPWSTALGRHHRSSEYSLAATTVASSGQAPIALIA